VKLISISIAALGILMTVNALLATGPVQTGTTATQVQQFWICVHRKLCENRALDLAKHLPHSFITDFAVTFGIYRTFR
jgi:hypothetical protein